MPSRRQLLIGLGALPVVGLGWPRLAMARTGGDRRLVVIVLRGGMDGLAAIIPYGDPAYRSQRGELAIDPPGKPGGALELADGFGLHPDLKTLHRLYQAGRMLPIHAVASPYRERSHFSAQDVLENGTATDRGARDGWLNRALPSIGGTPAMALGETVPLTLRGGARVTSWAPSILPAVNEDTLRRIAMLYEHDPLFGPALSGAMSANAIAGETMSPAMEGRAAKRRAPAARFKAMMQAAGRFLSAPDGPRIAVLDLNGWDTHAGQGTVTGRLARQFAMLDGGIAVLEQELADNWSSTAVLAVTEFGRTAAVNGTGGTDHGTAGAAFLAGGAVHGGRVLTDWPGLTRNQLREGRDLRPTTDIRAIAKGILHDHLGVTQAALDGSVFPDSAGVRPVPDLIRA